MKTLTEKIKIVVEQNKIYCENLETFNALKNCKIETLRNWLKSNDPNGSYDDDECGELTKYEALEIIKNQLELTLI